MRPSREPRHASRSGPTSPRAAGPSAHGPQRAAPPHGPGAAPVRRDDERFRHDDALRDAPADETGLNPTRNDLPGDARAQLVELLQSRLVDSIDLYLQVKNSHWNVKGPNFIALHELFDKVAHEALEYADELAERAVQLGGIPDGSAPTVAEESSLAATPPGFESEADHLAAVADALASVGRSAREGIDQADALHDRDTADILTEISRGVDKLLWFVESHLRPR